jgi:restriction system protein
MARRSRTTIVEDLIEFLAAIPWWAGLVLALATYAGLHLLAVREVASPKGPNDYSGLAEAFIQSWAGVLQYAVPAAFLAGAALSAFALYRRRRLAAGAAAAGQASVLSEMKWQEFSLLVAEGFKLKGYIVKERRGRLADEGFDLELIRGGERALVHCRKWRAAKVPIHTLQEFHGVMATKAASRGFVVTSGWFTEDARAFARGRHIELIDAPRLFAMFDDVRKVQTLPGQESAARRAPEPLCPKCGGPMVKRFGKHGAQRGQPFWGCSSYPACKGVRPA